jgi:hypothetical protein
MAMKMIVPFRAARRFTAKPRKTPKIHGAKRMRAEWKGYATSV